VALRVVDESQQKRAQNFVDSGRCWVLSAKVPHVKRVVSKARFYLEGSRELRGLVPGTFLMRTAMSRAKDWARGVRRLAVSPDYRVHGIWKKPLRPPVVTMSSSEIIPAVKKDARDIESKITAKSASNYPTGTRVPQVGLYGLLNSERTQVCYVNSAIQALFRISTFATWLQSFDDQRIPTETMLRTLRNLYNNMTQPAHELILDADLVRVKAVAHKAKTSNEKNAFPLRKQHDVGEFTQTILEALVAEELKMAKSDEEEKDESVVSSSKLDSLYTFAPVGLHVSN
jgi:hypothetical protein